jgi:hypothetical protein
VYRYSKNFGSACEDTDLDLNANLDPYPGPTLKMNADTDPGKT